MNRKIHLKTKLHLCLTAFMISAVLLISSVSAIASAYITTSVISLNSPPVAENIEMTTFRNVSITEKFKSVDPEGDLTTYSITNEPRKGAVTMDGDTFTYTPTSNKKGNDSFTYVATDSLGNISNEATVNIRIKKQTTDVSYSDMEGNPAWYAATALAEHGVFIGERLGEEYLFNPTQSVSRGEFLVMCMQITDKEVMNDIIRTGFYDDAEIPLWQKPYVTTALMNDMISGKPAADGGIIFSPDAEITFAEASVMLNNALEITDVSINVFGETDCTWAQQASANLASCDIIDTGTGISAAAVTRADAAKMLLGALDILEARKTSSSLLSWIE